MAPVRSVAELAPDPVGQRPVTEEPDVLQIPPRREQVAIDGMGTVGVIRHAGVEDAIALDRHHALGEAVEESKCREQDTLHRT